jgi:hypothetical protein
MGDLLSTLPLRSLPKPKNRHFDRSCSRFCEQRSGEICFSTEATHSIAFTITAIYFLYFQPKNRMSSPKTT